MYNTFAIARVSVCVCCVSIDVKSERKIACSEEAEERCVSCEVEENIGKSAYFALRKAFAK